MIGRESSPLRRLVTQCLRERRGALLLALACLGGGVLAELLAPWPLKVLLDHVLLARPLPDSLSMLAPVLALGTWPAISLLAASIALIALVGGAFSYLQIYTTARIGHGITLRLRARLFAHLQGLSLAFHQRGRSGELLTKVASDTNLLRDAFADWAIAGIGHLARLVAMLAVMSWLNWRLALVVATSLPPLLAVIYLLNKRVKATVRDQRRQEGRMASRLNEILSSMALVQAFGRQRFETERFQAEIEANFHSGVRTVRTSGAIARAIAVLSAAGTAITVMVGAGQVLAQALSPGELLIFLAYVNSLYKPVRDLGRLSAKFSRAAVSAQRVGEILETRPDAQDAPDAVELSRPIGEIVFEAVSFGYDPGRPVLDRVSFRIAAGEHVAIVGPSGAGKSTILALLLRLYEPAAGRILIDGVDIRRYTRESLRREIGIVLQDNTLFAVPVREAIAYGCPQAPIEAIERAARQARAHEFIVDLPDGYDTVLSERGATLSGGQRQRLCLARALVKEPAILVLDEPTAAIDGVSARLIHEAVRHAHRGRTLVVISHQYDEMAHYDRILVLRQGRLVESGPHAALLAARGTYLSLVEARHA